MSDTLALPTLVVDARNSDDGSFLTPVDSNLGTPATSTSSETSFQSIYTKPPPIKVPYNPKIALDDIPGIAYALELFLASHMHESEEYCHRSDEKKYLRSIHLLVVTDFLLGNDYILLRVMVLFSV